jgi:hypothetical protein
VVAVSLEQICQRLRIPKKLAEETAKLISIHMYDFNCEVGEKKVRKFIVRNFEYIPRLLKVKQADYSACKDDLSKAPTVLRWEKLIEKMKCECVPFTLKQLAVRGDQLIFSGIEREKVGKTLNFLLEQCAAGSCINDEKHLLKAAAGFVSNSKNGVARS